MNVSNTKAVILVAGDGGRLLPFSEATHKSLLLVKEKPLLWYSISNLKELGISDIVLVVGYKANLIKKFTEDFFPDVRFTFIFNRYYQQRNSIYSFFCASHLLYGVNFFRLAGDLFYNKEILIRLIDSNKDIVSAVEPRKKNSQEDFAVRVNEVEGTVLEYGKHISPESAYGVAQGIDYIRSSASEDVIGSLDKIKQVGIYTEFPEYAFQKIINSGGKVYYCNNQKTDFWCDIDTPEDLENINARLKE